LGILTALLAVPLWGEIVLINWDIIYILSLIDEFVIKIFTISGLFLPPKIFLHEGLKKTPILLIFCTPRVKWFFIVEKLNNY